jgi:hypothetical protein
MARRAWIASAVAATTLLLSPAGGASADVTIGTDVNNTTGTIQGTCEGTTINVNACVVTWPALSQGGPVTSPCDGTVTRFRINGAGPTTATYRLRVLHLSGTTATAVSASGGVPLMTNGVNIFPTSIPIHTGDQVGIEFTPPIAYNVVRYRTVGTTYSYRNGIPDSGSAPATSAYTGMNATEYLVNADVACTQPATGTTNQGTSAPTPTTARCTKKKHKREAGAAKKKRGCKKKKRK